MKSPHTILRRQDEAIHAALGPVTLDIPRPGVISRATVPGPKFGRRDTHFFKLAHTPKDHSSRRMESFRSLQCHASLDTWAFGSR